MGLALDREREPLIAPELVGEPILHRSLVQLGSQHRSLVEIVAVQTTLQIVQPIDRQGLQILRGAGNRGEVVVERHHVGWLPRGGFGIDPSPLFRHALHDRGIDRKSRRGHRSDRLVGGRSGPVDQNLQGSAPGRLRVVASAGRVDLAVAPVHIVLGLDLAIGDLD